MIRRAVVITAMLTFGIALPLSPATADPVRITGGSAVFDRNADAIVDFHGFQGLHAQFRNFLLNNTGPWQCGVAGPCLPGTILTPFGFIESIDGDGTVQFRGVSYTLGSTNAGLPGEDSAVISLRPTGPSVIVPPFAPRHVILTTSFELPGSGVELQLPGIGDENNVALTGKGIFTIELMPQSNGEPFWQMAQTRYDFAPTPEPATVVLMSSAIGILVLRRQRSRKAE